MDGVGLAGCVAQSWSPQIGDPEATGWLTVAAYLVCALLSLAVWLRLPRGRARGFWAALTVLMLFLALNKQLDLQSALTASGRCMSIIQGWYAERRFVQGAFLALLLAAMVAALQRGKHALQGNLRENRLALWGVTILAAFVMLRAVGIHFMDALIGIRHSGISVNYLFENAGLLLIALNAIGILRRGQSRTAGQS